MKKVFISLISLIINLYCRIFRLFHLDRLSYFSARIYTIYISNYLKVLGEGSCIYPPLKYCGLEKVTIGNNSLIGKHSVVNAVTTYLNDKYNPSIEIRNYVDIGEYAHISSINKIIIDDYVLIGRWLTIIDNSHGKFTLEDLKIQPTHRKLYTKGEVYIGDHVWIGDKVSIMPGVNIGRCSIIGSNSVVTHDIPEFSLAVGVPARVIKNLK